MTKEEDRGLLSRMVRFVRNPSVSWSDLDQSDLDPESRYSKQMLKDMIERRRRNDFVRKREFDMLRKLRCDNLAGAQDAARPSFFPVSNPNKPDERAKTIKKIDEIEAQMSQQWWKTKHGEADPAAAHDGVDNPNTDFSVSFPDQMGQTDYPSQTVSGLRSKQLARQPSAAVPMRAPPGAASNFQSTTEDPRRAAQDARLLGLGAVHASQNGGLVAGYDGQPSGFTASKLNALQVSEFVHDPQLEEAAIRFANGDDEGAEAALCEALANPDPTVNGNVAIWMTLFDLYRATGQQESFENVSLDFANRFGRTAPLWFSIPGKIRQHVPVFTESSAELKPHWKSPAVLDLQSLALMKASLEKAPQPWCLSWTALASIDTPALDVLYGLFTHWTDESVKLRFFGAEHLLAVLKTGTPSGDPKVSPLWWQIRMQVLRIMHHPDEFEVVALDYCVTYEVSPPSWDSALCNFKSMDEQQHTLIAAPTIVAESAYDGALSSLPPEEFTDTERTAIAALGSHVSAVDLSGHIMGDAVEMLDMLNAKLEGTDLIIVLCSRLIRLDFLAAGTLLNWVSTQQAEGRQVQFKDLHRLVAIFFNVIGINEHAKVIARTD